MEDDEILYVCRESIDHSPHSAAYVRVKMTVLFKYEKYFLIGNVPQTRVTITQKLDVGGAMPHRVRTQLFANHVKHRFDRSREIDSFTRKRYLTRIEIGLKRLKPATLSADEEEAVTDGDKFSHFFEQEDVFKSITMSTPLTVAKTLLKVGDGQSQGWSTTLVRSSAAEVLAFIWDTRSRATMNELTLERAVDGDDSGHSKVVYERRRMPNVITNREFLNKLTWKAMGSGTFIIVSDPTESLKRPRERGPSSLSGGIGRAFTTLAGGVQRMKSSISVNDAPENLVRGQFRSVVKITKVGDDSCRLEQTFMLDMSGGIGVIGVSKFVTNRYVMYHLSRVTLVEQYFQEQRGLDEYDLKDGRALGMRLMHPGESFKKPWAAVKVMVRRHEGLKEMSDMYEWFIPFLEEVVRGQFHFNHPVHTKLDCLSVKEAQRIGATLSPSLRARKTVDAGLYQWKTQNRAVWELFEEHEWVEEMMTTIGEEVMKTAPWGLALRVATGSGLSMLDLCTDIYVIATHWSKGGEEARVGMLLLSLVLLNILIQLIVVFVQNSRRRDQKMAKEFLIVLCGLKPGYDAYRVVLNNNRGEEKCLFPPKVELQLTVFAEMFCESIPSNCISTYMVLRQRSLTGAFSWNVVVSILSSALTTGFQSATVSYDNDTDPAHRRENPRFFGFIPDRKRVATAILVCMTLNSALLLLVRSFSLALLALMKRRYVFAYLFGDMVLYLGYKCARGDFHYWVPLDGNAGLAFSFFARVLVKFLTDFTGLIHFRHPGELGGAYWAFNLCLSVSICFGSVWIYLLNEEESSDFSGAIKSGEAWPLVGSVGCVWGAIFVVFFLLIKRNYRETFYSLKKGKEEAMELFQSRHEAVKASIVGRNERQWLEIRDQVKAWVLANWWRWKAERPEWLTENWKQSLPEDFVPKEVQERVVRRRRALGASAKNILGFAGGEREVEAQVRGTERGVAPRMSNMKKAQQSMRGAAMFSDNLVELGGTARRSGRQGGRASGKASGRAGGPKSSPPTRDSGRRVSLEVGLEPEPAPARRISGRRVSLEVVPEQNKS